MYGVAQRGCLLLLAMAWRHDRLVGSGPSTKPPEGGLSAEHMGLECFQEISWQIVCRKEMHPLRSVGRLWALLLRVEDSQQSKLCHESCRETKGFYYPQCSMRESGRV